MSDKVIEQGIVQIVVDSKLFDKLSSFGYSRDETKFIDEIMADLEICEQLGSLVEERVGDDGLKTITYHFIGEVVTDGFWGYSKKQYEYFLSVKETFSEGGIIDKIILHLL